LKHKAIRIRNIILLVIFIFAVFYFIPTPYIIRAPGTAENLSSMVKVNGGRKVGKGELLLTTVFSQKANLLFLLYAIMDRDAEIFPLSSSSLYGTADYENYMKEEMEQSKYMASVAALREAGYSISVKRNSPEIEGIIPDSCAKEILKKGDILLSVDSHSILFPDDVVKIVRKKKTGEISAVKVSRGGKNFTFNIPIIESEGKKVLGILIKSRFQKVQLPVNIEIESGGISGSSAGLMFTLEILSQLWKKDLARGKIIGGSGTIDEMGRLGSIQGVKYKILAAMRKGASIFILPRDNINETVGMNVPVRLIPVSTLKETLTALETIK